MASKYSSKLFNRAGDLSDRVEENLEPVRSYTRQGTDVLKAYFDGLKAARSARREANRELYEGNVKLLKSIYADLKNGFSSRRDEAGKTVTEATDDARSEARKVGDDLKQVAGQAGDEIKSRLDKQVENVKAMPGRLSESLDIARDAAGKISESLVGNETKPRARKKAPARKKATAKAAPKKTTPRQAA